MRLLLVAVLCWSAAVLGADTYKITDPDGKVLVKIVLRESACIDKDVLEYIHEHILDDRRFKKADVEWEGEEYGGCWAEKDGVVYPISSDKKPIRPPLPRDFYKDEAI